MKISFEGFDSGALTFLAAENMERGTIVALNDPGTVAPAGANDVPLGVVLNCDGVYACVGVKGVYTLPCDENIAAGFVCLETDSDGKLTEGSDGIKRFVLDTDEAAGTATVLL